MSDDDTAAARDAYENETCAIVHKMIKAGFGHLPMYQLIRLANAAQNARSIPAAAALLREAGWTVEDPKAACDRCKGRRWRWSGGIGITCLTCNGTGVRKESE
jgi:hypothetical protein